MGTPYAILADLDRCVECHACEIACQQENRLKEGKAWIRVVSIGPEEVDGRLCADYYPMTIRGCNFCRLRIVQGLEPFCVTVCPTKALKFYHAGRALAALRSEKRYQVCRIGEV